MRSSQLTLRKERRENVYLHHRTEVGVDALGKGPAGCNQTTSRQARQTYKRCSLDNASR